MVDTQNSFYFPYVLIIFEIVFLPAQWSLKKEEKIEWLTRYFQLRSPGWILKMTQRWQEE